MSQLHYETIYRYPTYSLHHISENEARKKAIKCDILLIPITLGNFRLVEPAIRFWQHFLFNQLCLSNLLQLPYFDAFQKFSFMISKNAYFSYFSAENLFGCIRRAAISIERNSRNETLAKFASFFFKKKWRKNPVLGTLGSQTIASFKFLIVINKSTQQRW